MTKFDLSLNDEDAQTDGANTGPSVSAQPKPDRPIMGWFAVLFGLLGVFNVGLVFVPLALICSIACIFVGQGTWAFIGLLLTLAGIMTSPTILALLGLGALAAWLGLPM